MGVKTKLIVFALAAAALYGGTSLYREKHPVMTAAAARPPVPVVTARAVRGELAVRLKLLGRVEAFESVSVRSRVDGQVSEVPFKEGQHVRAGEVLVRLDPADFDARLKQAEATLARDQALLVKARADLTRYTTAKTYVSEQQLAEARAGADAAAATVRADEAALALARLQLGYATIRAPFAGIVGSRLVYPGTVVKTNDTALVQLNRVQPVNVSFAVPERYLPQLREGIAHGGLPVRVGAPGEKLPALDATADFLDNAVDAATGTITVKARVPNQEERLSAGQFVNVSLAVEVLNDVVTVPAGAVQQAPGITFAFVVKPDGSVEQRRIEVSATQESLAVVHGIEAGETVVTDGQLRLAPGAKVVARGG